MIVTYTRKQSVVLTYGRLTNGYATGHYALAATIASTRRARFGWYGVVLASGARAMAHVSGIKPN
jgi:hypothetical protein